MTFLAVFNADFMFLCLFPAHVYLYVGKNNIIQKLFGCNSMWYQTHQFRHLSNCLIVSNVMVVALRFEIFFESFRLPDLNKEFDAIRIFYN